VLSIAATNPGIDCTTAAGRTARRDELSKAEDFSDCHSEKKQQLRMKAAFEDGRWIRRAPLGYENVNIKVKGQPNIVPHEAEAPLVRKAFELVQAGNDRPAEILRVMTELGLRSKKGNKLILTSFLQMLRNPVYMGQMQSKKWGTCKGLHSPLVTEHIFRNVQLILKGKKPIVAPYQLNRPDFPLRGFLRCHECNRPLTGGASKSQTGKLYDYYHCYRCPKRKSMPANKAANEFLQLLAQLRVDDSFSTEFSAQIKEEWETRTVDSAQIIRKLNIELQEKRGFQEKLFAKYLNDDPNVLPHYERFSQRS
jgi:site-specific DNA recombinase